ncbi:MAG: hypothetical protein H0U65_07035 [Rubrobacter sp.]|nr:hypothetical protein [Rubrobacter sp.]
MFIFENKGEAVGVTLHHPHGQIYGYLFVPPVPRRELEAAREYRRKNGSFLHEDLLARRRGEDRRLPRLTPSPHEGFRIPSTHTLVVAAVETRRWRVSTAVKRRSFAADRRPAGQSLRARDAA